MKYIFQTNNLKASLSMRIPHIVYLNVQIWLCVLLVFPRTHVVLAWVYMLQCTHVCGGCCAGIFVCGICVLISIINRRKLIQFIAFTYWPESFYREGLWLTGCVRKQEERKGESWKEREKGKKNGNMSVWKYIRVWKCFFHILKHNQAHGWLHLRQRVKKS